MLRYHRPWRTADRSGFRLLESNQHIKTTSDRHDCMFRRQYPFQRAVRGVATDARSKQSESFSQDVQFQRSERSARVPNSRHGVHGRLRWLRPDLCYLSPTDDCAHPQAMGSLCHTLADRTTRQNRPTTRLLQRFQPWIMHELCSQEH